MPLLSLELSKPLMIQEESHGVIPLKFENHHWQVFLVQHRAGHWGFPKGHAEKNESSQEAAFRELAEETGLQIDHLLTDAHFEEVYFYPLHGREIEKHVYYYLAEVIGVPHLDMRELITGQWFPLDLAVERMTFAEGKCLCRQAKAFLEGMQLSDR